VRRCGGAGRIRSGGEGKAGRSHTEAVPARRGDGSRRIGRIPAWIRGAAVDPAQMRRRPAVDPARRRRRPAADPARADGEAAAPDGGGTR